MTMFRGSYRSIYTASNLSRGAIGLARSLTFFLITAFSLIACAGGNDKEIGAEARLLLRYADEQSNEYPSVAAGLEFARLCREKTKGEILVSVYYDGKLGDSASVVEQVRFGGIDLARVSIHSLEEFSEAARRLGRIGAFPDTLSLRAAMLGPDGLALTEELLSEKIVVLAWYDGGPTVKLVPFSIQTPKNGYKVGVEPARSLTDYVANAGDTPITLTMRDFRHAYTTGLAEAFIMPLLAAATERLLDTHLPLASKPSRTLEILIASRAIYQKMAAKDRDLISALALESALYQDKIRGEAEAKFRAEWNYQL